MELSRARDVASRVEVLPEVASTNSALRALAVDAVAWPHLSVLVTDSQTAGRGRLDRVWTAAPGESLAISVLLRRLPADLRARGWIPLAAGVAMADAVSAQLPGKGAGVKWPNDVLVDGRKICGILAEAMPDAVIVGTGVNTAMTASALPVPTATSFAVLGVEVDVDRLLTDYLRALDARLAGLDERGDAVASGLHAAATTRCVTLGRDVRVSLPGDRTLEGRALRLDEDGRLVVRTETGEQAVSAGDVVHVRPAGS